MKIEIDLNRIEDGILVINIPDAKPITQKSIPAQKTKKDFTSCLSQYFTPAELISVVRKHRSQIDNSCMTKVLVSKGYIVPLKDSRCYIPGPNWQVDMGHTKVICSSHKNMNGMVAVASYNKSHPVIKAILKSIVEKE